MDEEGTSGTEPAADLEQILVVTAAEIDLPMPQNQNVDRKGVRVLPSRHSKTAHKILSDQSQKAKDKLPSNFSKKQNKTNINVGVLLEYQGSK